MAKRQPLYLFKAAIAVVNVFPKEGHTRLILKVLAGKFDGGSPEEADLPENRLKEPLFVSCRIPTGDLVSWTAENCGSWAGDVRIEKGAVVYFNAAGVWEWDQRSFFKGDKPLHRLNGFIPESLSVRAKPKMKTLEFVGGEPTPDSLPGVVMEIDAADWLESVELATLGV